AGLHTAKVQPFNDADGNLNNSGQRSRTWPTFKIHVISGCDLQLLKVWARNVKFRVMFTGRPEGKNVNSSGQSSPILPIFELDRASDLIDLYAKFGENLTILSRVIVVTDGRTDRQTDGQTKKLSHKVAPAKAFRYLINRVSFKLSSGIK